MSGPRQTQLTVSSDVIEISAGEKALSEMVAVNDWWPGWAEIWRRCGQADGQGDDRRESQSARQPHLSPRTRKLSCSGAETLAAASLAVRVAR